jgi:hypothetical protein
VLARRSSRSKAVPSSSSDTPATEETRIQEEVDGEVDGSEGSPHGRVIFACSPSDICKQEADEQEKERAISQRMRSPETDQNLECDKMTTSDDSFVKVIAFASSEDLGSDLSEFVKEIRLAPSELRSFGQESAAVINHEVDHLRS